MNMKKYLLFFLITSSVASLYRLYGMFLRSFKPIKIQLTSDEMVNQMLQESQEFARNQFVFEHNSVNKCFLIVLVVVMGLAIFNCLIKKFNQSAFLYMFYIFLNVVRSIYAYKGFLSLFSQVSVPEVHQLLYSVAQLRLYSALFSGVLYALILLFCGVKEKRSVS